MSQSARPTSNSTLSNSMSNPQNAKQGGKSQIIVKEPSTRIAENNLNKAAASSPKSKAQTNPNFVGNVSAANITKFYPDSD